MPSTRLAFLLLAHHDSAQLERLCGRLAGHAIFIHIDQRAKDFPVERIAALPGVVMVPRIPVFWGDFSVVEATLTLLRTAHAQGPFDRYILLSGACYPTRSMVDLEAAFTAEPEREWISLTPITTGSHLQTMIGRRWRMAPFTTNRSLDGKLRTVWNKVTKMLGRTIATETGMTPYFGNQFFALTGPCVQHVLSVTKSNSQLLQAYRSVYAPDEHVLHTIVGNSAFGAHGHAVPDQGAATNLDAPLHVVATNHERTFTSEDELPLIKSSGRFFLRKVSSTKSQPLLDRMDAELLHAGMAQ